MNKLAMFVPLAKADAAQRLVFGYFDETPDRAREIFDYASSKPNVQAWSDSFAKATDGKSVGNIRAQHGKIAAGVLEKIAFDDENKRVEFCARIVDDNEWKKVEAGVYTGFSPGGRYVKRWADPAMAGHQRYTAEIAELSIVDVPCNPAAGFTMVKADGVEEEVSFVMDKAYEPGNEATKARAEEMAKAAGSSWKDHVGQARADLISENASEALSKMATEASAGTEEAAPTKPFDALNAALAKADAALATAAVVTLDDDMTQLAKGLDQIILAVADAPMIKGLRGIQSLAGVIYQVVAVQSGIAREAANEGDNSPVPGQVLDGIKTLCDALVAMAHEEVAELLADFAEAGMEPDAYDFGQYACAAPIIDLVKADAVLMEKAGARNNKGDAAKIQSMHDNSVALGATCGAEKAAGLAAENERLAKAIGDAAPQIEMLVDRVNTLIAERNADRDDLAKVRAEIERLGALPAPTKIQQIIDKEQDSATASTLSKDAAKPALASLDGRERSLALEEMAIQSRYGSR